MGKGRFGGRGEEEEDEGGNWLDSYSDLVTDLMAIFVVLFSFAMMNQAIVAFDRAHSGEDAVDSYLNETMAADNVTLRELEKSLSEYIEEAELSDYLSITQQGENIVLLRVSASVLFDSAQAIITPDARVILDRVSQVLSKYGASIKMITVEGHADTRPINTIQFPSNWELSSTRAVNVVKYILSASGLAPEQFSAIGYAEFQPIADNDNEEGRAKNRRVDFIIELKDN